jgi:hypothetical protein
MGEVAQVVGAVMSVAGFAKQQDARDEQRKAAEEAAQARRQELAAQKARADVENTRSVRAAIRQQYAAQAGIIARGATTGTSASSGVAGGVASTGAQLAGNLSYMSNVADTQTASMQAAEAAGQANLAGVQANIDYAQGAAMSQMGGTIFSAGGGFDPKKSIFSR